MDATFFLRWRRRSARFVAGVLVVAIGTTATAVEPFVPNVAPPPVVAVAQDVPQAVVRISDCLWIDRELTRFAAALGRDPKPMRRILAEALYHTRSFDAIDTARPAVFMWSTGANPLQAIIPIHSDLRRQFVEEFGVMGNGEPPLVRVGDRDGTVVYTQNRPEGLREYRLLVIDSVAYLARNIDECRRLAARAATLLPPTGNAPPVALTCTGDWLRKSDLLGWTWSSRLPLAQWLPGAAMLTAAQEGLIGQTEHFSCEIIPGKGSETRSRLSVRLTANPESELAAWIATQQNQGSRLMSFADTPDNAIRAAIHIVWQDKLEQVAKRLLPALRTTLGASWTSALEDAWTQIFTVAQRSTDAAWSLQVPAPARQLQTVVIEQPRADEQAAHLEQIATALTQVKPVSATIAGFVALRRDVPASPGRPPLTQISAASSRHILLIDAWNFPEGSVLARAENVARRLQVSPTQMTDPALLTVSCNLGRLMYLCPTLDTEVTIPDAMLSATVRTAGVNVLVGDVSLSLAEAANALSHLPDEAGTRR